jgi:tetratricopeptide (TPR) repeat protein
VSGREPNMARRGVEKETHYLEALSLRARLLGREGRTDQEVIEVNTAILRIDANRDDAYIRRGICYQKRGQLDRAEEDLRRAIDLNPNNRISSHC